MSFSIASNMVNEILDFLPENKIILELGTGSGTQILAEHYSVISIENQPKWHTGHSKLFHVPLKLCSELGLPQSFWQRFKEATYWYDVDILKKVLEECTYDMLLIDGPKYGRTRIAMWWFYSQLFDMTVPVVVDDVHRTYDWAVATNIARNKNVYDFKVFLAQGDKAGVNMFAVIK